MMIRNSLWILFSKYFAGECSEAELEKLNGWIAKKNSNLLLFNKLQKDRDIIDKYKKMKNVDVDKAWDSLSKRIEATGVNNLKFMVPDGNKSKKIKVPFLIGLAASILIVAGLLITFKSIVARRGFETIFTADENASVTLSDGSRIFMNRDSKVMYPKEFGLKQRELYLTGEAFFEVTPDARKPFIVKAGRAMIKVIGTSFTVNERAGKNRIEVFVETGKVSLYQEKMENTGIMIEPGYVGQLAGNSSTKYLNKDDNIMAWKTRKIVFSETRLAEVIKVLEKVYGKHIIIENKEALNWPYTNTFDNQDFESVTKVLVDTYHFGIEQDRNKIVLTGGNSGV
jgi:transmembrane sensor